MRIDGSQFRMHSAYQANRTQLQKSLRKLASGDNFENAGEQLGGHLSMAERLRYTIHTATASTNSLQQAKAFLDTADAHIEAVTHIVDRMTELAARASDGMTLSEDSTILEAEFQALKHEITLMTRNGKFAGRQTISKEVVMSFDPQNSKMRFWQPTGLGQAEIHRDFSSTAQDILGQRIGFDSSESFSMSRDGKSLYFMGNVTGDAAGVVRFKKYDIDNKTVYTGADLFASGDTLFVDDRGDVYINGNGTVYEADASSMVATATTITDAKVGGKLAGYQGSVIYQRTGDGSLMNLSSAGVLTNTTGALTFAVGVDHTFSPSGNYIADIDSPGQIRVIDTKTLQQKTISIGGATTVNNIQFSADGDRIYYLNQATQAIEMVSVGTETDGSVILQPQGAVIRADGPNCFSSLSIGGSNYSSSTQFIVAEDSLSKFSYEAADLSLYQIGLANAHIDTIANATSCLSLLQDALTKVNAERAKIGAMASRFDHTLNIHMSYIQSATEAQSAIRDVDVAKETSLFSMLQMRDAAATAMLAQFHTLSKNVLQLLHA
ncbi:MAG: flagellin [Chlamydiales bacterium]|nr:flagellin [Chlamydiales bacterium]